MNNLLKSGMVALVAAMTVLPTIAPAQAANPWQKAAWQNRNLHRYYSPRYRTPYYGGYGYGANAYQSQAQLYQKGAFTNQINQAVGAGALSPADGNMMLIRGY